MWRSELTLACRAGGFGGLGGGSTGEGVRESGTRGSSQSDGAVKSTPASENS